MDKVNNLKQWHQQHQQLFSQDPTFGQKFNSSDIDQENVKLKEDKLHWQKCYNDSFNSNASDKLDKENISPEGEMVSKSAVSLDELPVCGVKKNFNDLLNDKLEASSPEENESGLKPKRIFLKKGQGLARFKPGTKFTIKQTERNNNLKQKKTTSTQNTVPSINKKTTDKKILKQNTTKNKIIQETRDLKSDSLRMFELEEQTANSNSLLTKLMQKCNGSKGDNESFFDVSIQNTNVNNLEKKIEELSISNHDILNKRVIDSSNNSRPNFFLSSNENETKNKNRRTFVIKHNDCVDKLQENESDHEILPYGTDIEEVVSQPKTRVRFSDQDNKFDDEEEWAEEKSTSAQPQKDNLKDSNNELKNKHFNSTNYQLERKSILKESQASNDNGDNIYKNQLPVRYFESSILEQRLQELKKEIEMFRSENEQLNKIKRELEKEQVSLKKEKRDLEKRNADERKTFEDTLKQEKLKLVKERKIWDNFKERNIELESKANFEIEQLKQQIKLLQSEKNKKVEKESGALIKYRERIKTLERENDLLKDETEQLKKRITQMEVIKRSNPRASNTKLINQINEEISKKSIPVENRTVVSYIQEKKNEPSKIETSINTQEINLKINKTKTDKIAETSKEQIIKETDVYELLCENNIDDNESSSQFKDNEPLIELKNNKRIKTWPDGRKEIIYPNKNLKKISADGNIEKLIYANGDVKEVDKTLGVSKYFYSENKVYETTYPDKLQVLEFPCGQIEKRWPNGKNEITLNDGTVKIHEADGSDKLFLPDGSTVINENGVKTLSFPNGQREIHTKDHKRREYPDGSVKYLYENGTIETRYANGRIKMKDISGNIIKMINEI